MTSAHVVASLQGSPPAAPSDPVARIGARLSRVHLSPINAVVLALLLTGVAAYGDSVTTAAATFTLFYIASLVLAVWFAGIRAAYVVGLVADAGSTLASMEALPAPSNWFLVWNACLDLILYAAFIHVLWALRQRLQQEIQLD